MGIEQGTSYGTVLKWWRRALITVTALSAAAASFVFLRDLALHVGWPLWAAVLLPLSIDALAAAALTEYRLTGSRTAAGVAVLAIVGSATGNAYSHLYTTGLLVPGWVAVTAVGAVPAVTVGLTVHLFTARRSAWTPSSSSTETGGGSQSAPGSGTATSSRPTLASRRSAGAPGAASSHRGGSSTTPSSPSHRGKTSRNRSGNRKTTGSPQRTDTEIVSLILEHGWTELSLDKLVSNLQSIGRGVAKRRVGGLREQARQRAREPKQEPEPEHEFVSNGRPSNPETATATVLAHSNHRGGDA